jgi:glycosyltransferase involved in cell wall biosynthesis
MNLRTDRPKISVVVASYNAAPYLPSLCNSILEQTFQDFEVIILDDGSNDGSYEVLRQYDTDDRFTILRWHNNRGVDKAWFHLLTKVRGEFWCCPGADDLLKARFLESRITLLESRPHAVLAHGPPEVVDSTGKLCRDIARFERRVLEIDAEKSLRIALTNNYINTSSVVVRTDLTRLILAFFSCDWKFAQDWFLWILLIALGQPVLWDPEPLNQYRVHKTSLSHDPSKAALRGAENRLVPLCALAVSSSFSALARQIWGEMGGRLYRLWLRRAVALTGRGRLRREWSSAGAIAYYGRPCHPPLLFEFGRHGLGILYETIVSKPSAPHQNGIGADNSFAAFPGHRSEISGYESPVCVNVS